MSFSAPTKLYHGNRYSADSECEHCQGIIRHEPWCITRNHHVYEAFECVLDDSKLSVHDQLILHALGVTWEKPSCGGACPGNFVR